MSLVTKNILRAVAGQRLPDAQARLLRVPMGFISTLVRLRPNGYDFELEALLACKRTMRSVSEIPIETVYLDGNRSSHFNPLLDSMRIYFVLIRFANVSLSTAVLDNLVFLAAFHFLSHVLASLVLGRLVAGLFQYYMNKTSVFQTRVRASRAFPRYSLSMGVFAAASYAFINVLLSLGFAVPYAKLCAETVLFAFSFVVQRDFVFHQSANSTQTE